MKVLDLFDDSSSSRYDDRAWHQSITTPHAAIKGFWLVKDGKKLSGPFTAYDKAASFKANRKDKIPVDAVIKEL